MKRNVRIEELLERYFAVQTTEAEERALHDYFRRTKKVPAELRDAQAMFAGLDALAAERMPKRAARRSSARPFLNVRKASVWGFVAAAALALGLFFAADLFRRPYCYIDGKAIYDQEVAMQTTRYLDGFAELDAAGRMLDELIENRK